MTASTDLEQRLSDLIADISTVVRGWDQAYLMPSAMTKRLSSDAMFLARQIRLGAPMGTPDADAASALREIGEALGKAADVTARRERRAVAKLKARGRTVSLPARTEVRREPTVGREPAPQRHEPTAEDSTRLALQQRPRPTDEAIVASERAAQARLDEISRQERERQRREAERAAALEEQKRAFEEVLPWWRRW